MNWGFELSFSKTSRWVWFVTVLALLQVTTHSQAQIVYSSDEINPTPGPLGEDFGSSVALGPTYMIIGSEFSDDVGLQSGGVSVHSRATGAFIRKLTPPSHFPSDLFGSSVAIDGNTVVAGSRIKGKAYLFDAATGNWLRTLQPSDGAAATNFGISCAIYGDIVLVGSVGSPNLDGTIGGVYAYSLSSPTDNEIVRLRPDFFMGDDRFGHSVALNDAYAVVGVSNNTSNGAVYVFDINTGARLHRLVPDPSPTSPSFGESVAIVGNLIVVGASRDSDGGTRAGAVYLFDAVTGDRLLKLTPPEITPFDYFGVSVGVSNNALMVGAPGDMGARGSVYVFAGPDLDLIDIVIPPETNGGDRFGEVISIDGAEALVGAPNVDPKPGAAYRIFPRCAADLNEDGAVDFFDVSFFINFMVDFNGDGVFNFFDVSDFVNAYQSGCP